MHLSRTVKKLLGILCVSLLCASFAYGSSSRRTGHSRRAVTKPHVSQPRSTHSKVKKGSRSRKPSKASSRRTRGQQSIDGERAREIQEALIRAKYLDGEPTGVWDQQTRDAMMRFQNENGWQTKVVPDSRALIKLGLGPKHADLINPESVAMPDSARGMQPGGSVPPQR